MPIFLNTFGNAHLSVAICDRCRLKKAYDELRPDGNSPGLRVCEECCDQLDPYRLPMRQVEQIAIRFARPDVSVVPDMLGTITEDNQFFLITEDGLSWLIP